MGSVPVKGTVDFNAINARYKGALLTTFTLKNKAAPGQTYVLTLDLFRTLGPTESVFVDGAGVNLDPSISFQSVEVMVVPEPSVAALVALSSIALLGYTYGRRALGSILSGRRRREKF